MSYLRSPERQRQILSCAKKVFAARGYHAANISHICDEAGIGRGTLYQYFDNKRAVLVAILEDVLARIRTHMAARRPLEVPAALVPTLTQEQILDYSQHQLGRLLGVVFSDEETLRIVLREAVGLDVDVEKLLATVDTMLIAFVERDLAAAREAGIVREDLDLHHVATMIVGGVEKLALAALRSDAPVDVIALTRSAVSFHLYGTIRSHTRGKDDGR